MNKYTVLVAGDEITSLVVRLVRESCWFEVEPLPDDQWEVSVKVGDESRLIGFRRSDVG